MKNLRELLLARVGGHIKVNWIMGSGLPGVVKSIGDDYFVLTTKERSGDALTTDYHIPFASVLHFRDLPNG